MNHTRWTWRRVTGAALGLACVGACAFLLVAPTLSRSAPKEASPGASLGPAAKIAPLPPLADAPQPPASAALGRTFLAAHLPWAEIAAVPVPLPSEGQKPIRLRPTADLPPLASDTNPVLLPHRQLPAGPLTHVDSPDIAQVPSRYSRGYRDPDQPTWTTDPTLEQSLQVLLSVTPSLKKPSAPFLRLTIPDPFETRRAVQFCRQVPDEDPPATTSVLPGKPTLSK